MSILKKLREQTQPLDVKEVAAMFDVGESTVQRWVRTGELPAIRVSDTIRFDPEMLADWIEQSSLVKREQEGTNAGTEERNA